MHVIEPEVDNVMRVKVSGKLTREEYADLVPKWEQAIAIHGKLRLLFEMEPGFTGWEPTAAFEDLKFSLSHRSDLERVAMVGEKKWEQFVATAAKLLLNFDVRYFDQSQVDQALTWLRE